MHVSRFFAYRPTFRTRDAITVRGLAPELKTRLHIRAAHNAHSMEAEARQHVARR